MGHWNQYGWRGHFLIHRQQGFQGKVGARNASAEKIPGTIQLRALRQQIKEINFQVPYLSGPLFSYMLNGMTT
jgi:hypothetical protein